MRPTIDPEIMQAEAAALRSIYHAKKKALGVTQERIACEGLGARSQSAVSHYMSGKTPLNLNAASVFARYLQTPIDSFSPRLAADMELLHETPQSTPESGAQSRTTKAFIYPVRGKVGQGEWSAPPPDQDTLWEVSRVDAGTDGFWLRLDSDSMISSGGEGFPVNSLLLVKPQSREILPGKLYVFRTAGGQGLFRAVLAEGDEYYLRPMNISYRTSLLGAGMLSMGEVVDAKINIS